MPSSPWQKSHELRSALLAEFLRCKPSTNSRCALGFAPRNRPKSLDLAVAPLLPRTARISLCIVLLFVSFVAGAEGFGHRFEEGYEALRSGNPEAALASFRDLLTETPDSDLVNYSIAAAEYAKGIKDLDAGNVEQGMEMLAAARADFDGLATSETPFVRRNAPYSAANSLTQVAKHLDENEEYEQRLQALRDAVDGYGKVLDWYPDHDAARTNLNHARYLLKKMLQNPPPEQEKADDGEGDDQQGNQDETGDEGDQGPQPEEGEQGDDESKVDDQSEGDSQPNNSGENQSEASQGDPLDDANIEAILQSLEDKNREEQKNLRKAKGAPRVKDGKWW